MTRPPGTLDRWVRSLLLIHPFPTSLLGVLVACLALLAGADPGLAAWLAIGMLGYQSSIGALNDLVDAPMDVATRVGNPVADGLVSRRLAMSVVAAGAVTGMTVSASRGPDVLLIGAAGWVCGVVYDTWPWARRHGWLCLGIAFPLLFAWTWVSVRGVLPPDAGIILLAAALAGPMVHEANRRADDGIGGPAGIEGTSGGQGSRDQLPLAALLITVYGVAWLFLLTRPIVVPALALATAASITAAVGLRLTARRSAAHREHGWQALAIATALLALACVLAVTP